MVNKRYTKYKNSYIAYRNKNRIRNRQLSLNHYYKNKAKYLERGSIHRFGIQREVILERDNWCCVKCGMTQEQHIVLFGRGLSIDHIDGNGRYSKRPNNNQNNLQTLCLRCHGKKDRARGIKALRSIR